ncbi:MAG TPA: hypothetical protein GXX19_12385 [Syntrophomonadaceae bacterium]|nr:hypothetical protein [Syntrophomonadaceae bacterium]
MIRCSFCGLEFLEKDAVAGCSGCPLHGTCGKLKCPHCGYEIPKEPGLIRWLKKWMGERRHAG